MTLESLFSAESQQKFNRESKPQEIVREKKVTAPAIDESKSSGDERQVNHKNSKRERVEETEEQKAEKANKTLFIGNVSTSTSLKAIRKICEEFGEIDSVRMRSLPVSGAAVDDHGNQDLVRKVCAIKKKFGDQKASMNVYVVFKEAESVEKALSMNNTVVDERHLRFDRMTPANLDNRRTVFVGSLHHHADEEQLREHFAQVLLNGHDDIDCVRIIRDPETLAGKGIAYVCFKSAESVVAALSLHQVILSHTFLKCPSSRLSCLQKPFKKRELRVTVCHRKPKKKSHPGRNPNPSFRADLNKKRKHEGKNADSAPTSDAIASTGNKKSKKTPLSPAQKRINLKVLYL